MTQASQIKDKNLADQGRKNLEIATEKMSALLKIQERFEREKPFANLKIGMALHITKETGVLVKTLKAGGAKIAISSCNPLSTQDDIASALAQENDVLVYGYKGESLEDYNKYIDYVLEFEPDLIIDDGCDLVNALIAKFPDLAQKIIGGCEETTTGVHRLKAMEKEKVLPFPMIAVNDNMTKHLMDNLYGTGQSTLDGILRATNVMLAGKTIVIAGYGSCGKGIAMRAKGMGSQVIITEINPFRALQAHMDGHKVMTMHDASKIGDIFITVTGNCNVINMEHVFLMKSGAILCNSGHFDAEINMAQLKEHAQKIDLMRPSMEKYTFNRELDSNNVQSDGEMHVYVLGEGRLVNLACAEGHPSEVMALSFCGQALACEYIVKHAKTLEKGVHTLPESIDLEIAQIYLDAEALAIDKPTEEQIKYMNAYS